MSAITREQFVRGIAAVQAYDVHAKALYDLMSKRGDRCDGLGEGPLSSELVRQLEERCNDPHVQHGSMIEYMLYDAGGPVHLADGRKIMTNTPELLWAYWQETATGPFSTEADQS